MLQNITFKINRETAYFEGTARALVAKGWSVFPQTQDRKPALIGGNPIKPFSEHNLDKRLPYKTELDGWIKYCPDSSVACVMGDGSGRSIAVDIDVTDEALADKITDIAINIFGDTPLKRVGLAPKIALIYRSPEDGSLLPSRAVRAIEGGHGIDILSRGKMLTYFGTHHKTGRPYAWIEGSPMMIGPQDLPIITRDQLKMFLEAVAEVMPLSSSNLGADQDVDITVEFTENAEGKIDDGREKWLTKKLFLRVREWLQDGRANDHQTEVLLTKEMIQEFALACVCDGRWEPSKLKDEINGRVRSLLYKYRTGALSINTSSHTAPSKPMAPVAVSDVSLLSRADHQEVLNSVSETLGDAITYFLGECNAPLEERNKMPGLHIAKAPPGIGKTTTLVRRIADDPATYRDVLREGKAVRAPYIMLVPTYRNIYELRDKAAIFGINPDLSDAELAEEGKKQGLIQDGDFAALQELRKRIQYEAGPGVQHGGFKVGIYQGRIRAGCAMKEQMQAAMDAQIGGSQLCKKPLSMEEARSAGLAEGERELRCAHYSGCPAILQTGIFSWAHMVLMPHAFLALRIPEEAKCVRGIIVDERAHDLFLHTKKMSLDTLDRNRKAPKLSRKAYEAEVLRDPGFTRDLYEQQVTEFRHRGAEIVTAALKARIDPAKSMMDQLGYDNALKVVRVAKDMCSASMKRDKEIMPNMPMDKILEVASEPTGIDAGTEWQFWSILEERLLAIFTAQLEERVLPGINGSGDARIQYLAPQDTGEEWIRLSWRTEPNWLDTPTMLLDASAAPEIVRKVWNRTEDAVIETDLVTRAALYRRIKTVLFHVGAESAPAYSTFANTSLVGVKGNVIRTIKAASTLLNVRTAISALSLTHATGRVLVGCNIPVRRILNQFWIAPANVDFGHFGALRGLDVYKNHEAAISIGRLEVPVDVIDGIAAALTYDDETPEEPLDKYGTGYIGDTPAMPPSVAKNFRTRSGKSLVIEVPKYPGKWAAMVQAQYREEELVQFLGRMRPFHRDAIPTWYAISSVLPEDVIIDEVVSMDQIVARFSRDGADVARLTGGTLNHNQMPTWWSWADGEVANEIVALKTRHIPREAARGVVEVDILNRDGSLAYYGKSRRITDKLDEEIGSDQARISRELELHRAVLT